MDWSASSTSQTSNYKPASVTFTFIYFSFDRENRFLEEINSID